MLFFKFLFLLSFLFYFTSTEVEAVTCASITTKNFNDWYPNTPIATCTGSSSCPGTPNADWVTGTANSIKNSFSITRTSATQYQIKAVDISQLPASTTSLTFETFFCGNETDFTTFTISSISVYKITISSSTPSPISIPYYKTSSFTTITTSAGGCSTASGCSSTCNLGITKTGSSAPNYVLAANNTLYKSNSVSTGLTTTLKFQYSSCSAYNSLTITINTAAAQDPTGIKINGTKIAGTNFIFTTPEEQYYPFARFDIDDADDATSDYTWSITTLNNYDPSLCTMSDPFVNCTQLLFKIANSNYLTTTSNCSDARCTNYDTNRMHDMFYSFLISVSASGPNNQKITAVFNLTITNVQENPSGVAVVETGIYNENTVSTDPFGYIACLDDEDGYITDTLLLPANAFTSAGASVTNYFERLESGGKVYVKPKGPMDYEGAGIPHSFTLNGITCTDSGGKPLAPSPGSVTWQLTNINEPPSDCVLSTGGNTITLPENQSLGRVFQFIITDPDVTGSCDVNVYTFCADNFTLDTGSDYDGSIFYTNSNLKQVILNGTLDYEDRPSHIYVVNLRVSDAGFATTNFWFNITLTNVNEKPEGVSIDTNTIAENQPASKIGTLTASDPDVGDVITFTIPAGFQDKFEVKNSNELWSKISFDYEAQSSYTFVVTATDKLGLTGSSTITINILDVNEPVDTLNIIFGSSSTIPQTEVIAGATLATVICTDPEHESVVVAVTNFYSGATNYTNQLYPSGNQLLFVNRLEPQTYNVIVTCTETTGIAVPKAFTFTVERVNQPPDGLTLSSNSLPEDSISGYQIGQLTGSDPDGDALTYSMDPAFSASEPKFTICSVNYLCVSSFVTSTTNRFDFETDAPYTVHIRARDNDYYTTFKFTITLTDVNEAPTDILPIQFTVTVNTNAGDNIGSFSTVDQDFGDEFTYELQPGSDPQFYLVGNNLFTNYGSFNYLVKPTYKVNVKTTDRALHTLTKEIQILVTQNNNAPTNITLSSYSIGELSATGIVGDFSTVDVDVGQDYEYSLVDNANGMFSLVGTYGPTLVADKTKLNYESVTQYQITVRSTDSGTPRLSVTVVFTIRVIDENEPAQNLYLTSTSVKENSYQYTTVGKLSCDDPDAVDTLVYTVIGTGNSTIYFFANNSVNPPELQVKAYGLDYETFKYYPVLIQVRDKGNIGTNRLFNISLTDVNEAPTNILNLSPVQVNENSAIGTTVTTFATVDPDLNQQYVYVLTVDAGGFFYMSGNALKVNKIGLDYERNQTMSITVNSTDNGRPALTVSKTFTVTILDVNEAATITMDTMSVDERSPVGTLVGSLVIDDPEVSQAHTCDLISNPGTSFKLVNTAGHFQVQVNRNNLDALATPTISISIQCTDVVSAGQIPIPVLAQFVIAIGNINDPPTKIIISTPSTVQENTPAGQTVVTFTAVDSDLEDSHYFTLLNDTCNVFDISGNALVVKVGANIDYEAIYPITFCTIGIRTTDTGTPALSYERMFNITVTDVNEPPTAITLSYNSTVPSPILRENDPPGTYVGMFNCTDPDRGQTFRYNLQFAQGQDTLTIVESYKLGIRFSLNYEVTQSVSFNVSCTDNGVPPLTITSSMTIPVIDVNEPPTRITLNNTFIPETAPIGSVLGYLFTEDQDLNEVFRYELVDDGSGRFSIDTTSVPGYARVVASGTLMNAQRVRLVRITVRVFDKGDEKRTENFDVTLTPVNLPPTGLTITISSLLENSPAGTEVGTLSVIDPDVGDTHNCSIVDSDNGSFTVIDNKVFVADGRLLDYEVSQKHTITVQCTDAGSLPFATPQSLELTLEDVNEPGTDITLSQTSVLETAILGEIVTTLTSLGDPEPGQSHTYIIADTNSSFTIAAYGDDSANIRLAKPLNHDLAPVMTIRLISTDNGWPPASFTKNVTINVIDVNPCLSGSNGGCNGNATCFKSGPGQSTCVCNEGYIGTGYVCSPLGTNNITCVAPANAASCNTCKVGFEISALSDQCGLINGVKLCTRSCVDVNECARTDNGACCSDIDCENREGYFSCGGFGISLSTIPSAMAAFPGVTRGELLCALSSLRVHNETNLATVSAALFGVSDSSVPLPAIIGAAIGGLVLIVIIALVVMKSKQIGPFRRKGYDESEEQDEELIHAKTKKGKTGAGAAGTSGAAAGTAAGTAGGAVQPAVKSAEDKILDKLQDVEEQLKIQRQEAINRNMKVFEKIVLKNKIEASKI